MDTKPYAIIRTEKLKSILAIKGSLAHTARTISTPNADPERTPLNQQLIGFGGKIPTPEMFLEQYVDWSKDLCRKRDAVLLQEVMLTASPEYFRSGTPEERQKQCQDWVSASISYLSSRYGDMLKSATLHADESTTHIVGYILPVARAKDGKLWLSAKSYFSPRHLADMQTTYAHAVAHLGLIRGVPGSRAYHTEIRTWYAFLTRGILPDLHDKIVEFANNLLIKKPFEREETYGSRLKDYFSKHVAAWKSDLEQVAKWEGLVSLLRRQLSALKATVATLEKQVRTLTQQNEKLTAATQDLNLEEVLPHLGYALEGPTDETSVWVAGESRIVVTANRWKIEASQEFGTSNLDLICRLLGCDIDAATGILRSFLGYEKVQKALAAYYQSAPPAPLNEQHQLTHTDCLPENPKIWDLMQLDMDLNGGISMSATDAARNNCQVYGTSMPSANGSSASWTVFVFHPWETYDEPPLYLLGCAAVAVNTSSTKPGSLLIGDLKEAFHFAGTPPHQASHYRIVDTPADALRWATKEPQTCTVCTPNGCLPGKLLDKIAREMNPIEVVLRDNDARRFHSTQIERELQFREAAPDLLQIVPPETMEKMIPNKWFSRLVDLLQQAFNPTTRPEQPKPSYPEI